MRYPRDDVTFFDLQYDFVHCVSLLLIHWFIFSDMASQFLNRLGQLGLGVAVVGGVVNSALYNGNTILFHFQVS